MKNDISNVVVNVSKETRAKLYKIAILRTTETFERVTMKDVVEFLADKYLEEKV